MEKRKISIRLEPYIYDTLLELQDEVDINVSQIIRAILEDYTKLYKLNKLKSNSHETN